MTTTDHGRWRFLIRNSDGSETGFLGAYREVSPPERIVQTFEWEGMSGHVSVETATFEDLGEQTKVITTSVFHTTEERDGMLGSGMEGGLTTRTSAWTRCSPPAARGRTPGLQEKLQGAGRFAPPLDAYAVRYHLPSMAGIGLRKRPHIARPTSARPMRVKGATVPVPVVEFEDVTKVYDGGSIGLERATMSIGRGEFVFLVGPTGCGKSTAIRLLQKELEASAGEIRIAGHELSSMPRSKVPQLRRNIGVVFQDYKLLANRTIYDNVAYSLQVIGEPRQEIRRKVPDILRLVGLSTKLHNYPDELSGGEQQRVSIARAFVNHPPLLLADEPTGNLDPETSIGIMQLIYRINRTGTTVVVATHDSAMVDKMRRRVIELREGRIIRDELSGLYRPDESTTEFAIRLRGELGVGHEGHPN